MIARIETKAGLLYQSQLLSSFKGLYHGFGTRGILLADYLECFGMKDVFFARIRQSHSSRVCLLGSSADKDEFEGDAFVTTSKGVVCYVKTADCVPILLYDAKMKVVAAVHAGWRGTALDVVGNTIRFLSKNFGTEHYDLTAAIGPSICEKCYSVGEEVIEVFYKKKFSDSLWRKSENGLYNLDLKKANYGLMLSNGLQETNITIAQICTFCHEKDFASYRRDRSEKLRQINFIFMGQ